MVDNRVSAIMFKSLLVIFLIGIVAASIYGIYFFKFKNLPGEVIGEIELPGDNDFRYEFEMPYDGNIALGLREKNALTDRSLDYSRARHFCEDKYKHIELTPIIKNGVTTDEVAVVEGKEYDVEIDIKREHCTDLMFYGFIETTFFDKKLRKLIEIDSIPGVSTYHNIFYKQIALVGDLRRGMKIEILIKTRENEANKDITKGTYAIIKEVSLNR